MENLVMWYKFTFAVCLLPFAVNGILNLSSIKENSGDAIPSTTIPQWGKV